MKKPVKFGDAWIDASEVACVLPQDGKLLIFIRSGKVISVDNTFSAEEIRDFVRKTE